MLSVERPEMQQNGHRNPIVGRIVVQPILRPGVTLISYLDKPYEGTASSKTQKTPKMVFWGKNQKSFKK